MFLRVERRRPLRGAPSWFRPWVYLFVWRTVRAASRPPRHLGTASLAYGGATFPLCAGGEEVKSRRRQTTD